MAKEVINKPLVSNWIGGMYISILIFVALLYLIVYLEATIFLKSVFNAIMILILLIILITTMGFYNTKYRIKDGFLYSWSPFMIIKVNIKDIKKVEKTTVPMHFRVGASLYSGSFYVPNLGWVNSIITNLKDAILITTKKGKYYMITPSNPEKFMKLLK
jgi:hypothetical protein